MTATIQTIDTPDGPYRVRAGHVDDNVPLPLGARVTLDATKGTLRFHGGATE